MKTIILLGVLFMGSTQIALAFTFPQAIKKLESHEAVKSLSFKADALVEEGISKGSWGDPMFKLAAKNFPKDTLKDDETPMTGIEVGISQKIALTTKYGNMQDAFKSLGQAKRYDSEDRKRFLIKSLWHVLIDQKRLREEIKIFGENLEWVAKILKVSKKLYANGKISQQALLDIQIRKSEIEAALSNKEFELKESQENLTYLLGFDGELDVKSIPWELAESRAASKIDLKELSFQEKLKSREKMLSAQKQAFVPDVTVALSYTKRSNIDNRGDFVAASLVFPLPLSGKKYAGHAKAVHEKAAAQKSLRNYQRKKHSEEKSLEHRVSKIEKELEILNDKTLKFAENSRKVTSKSYGYGRSSYVELLQSELKLQSLLLKRSKLNAGLVKTQIEKKYLIGEKLYE